MKKFNAGYEITEHMNIGQDHFVLGYNPEAPSPYVTWATNEVQDYFVYGHYFSSREAAVIDLIRRATDYLELNGLSLARALMTEDDRYAIQEEYRRECAEGDIESALEYTSQFCDDNYDIPGLLSDESFMAKAMHRYYNIDHSAENEALADCMEEILRDKAFDKYKIPDNMLATLYISPEEAQLVNDLMSMPSAQIPKKYGPLGDNIQFHFQIPSCPMVPGGMKASLEIVPSEKDGLLSEIDPPYAVLQVIDPNGEEVLSETYSAADLEQTLTQEYEVSLGNGIITFALEENEFLRRIGNSFVYQANTETDRYADHNGEICTVRRALTPNECDILISGLMWEAEFPNGDVLHVFDEELSEPAPEKQLKPALDNLIQSAQAQTNAPTDHEQNNKDLDR